LIALIGACEGEKKKKKTGVEQEMRKLEEARIIVWVPHGILGFSK
jgi:hypothetical protein